jgi:hypothetical protein
MIQDLIHTKNFWEEYPNTKIDPRIHLFWETDKSPNKEETSKIMWALAYCLERHSPLFNSDAKWESVKKTIIKDDKFKWSNYDTIKIAYTDLCLTPEEKAYHELLGLLENRRKYYSDFKYKGAEAAEIKVVEQMIGNTLKLNQDIAKVKELLQDKTMKQPKNKSLSDSGKI